jgi:hypothetical protein
MKKITLIALIVVLVLAATVSLVCAGGPWAVKVEGNGTVNGGSLPSYGVLETDIGWNFKWNVDTGEVNGHLNIVEKRTDGTVRHFQLSGAQVLPVGDPTGRPILFNCASGGGDARSIRVEGWDDQGRLIAAHFRDSEHSQYPSSVWYWVQDASGSYITNTNARLTVSYPFTMECLD